MVEKEFSGSDKQQERINALVDDLAEIQAAIDADLAALKPLPCTGRLTLASGTPVTTSDVTAATTLYFALYMGNKIGLYNGNTWDIYTFTERSLSLAALAANTNYDIFIYDNAGTLTLEAVAWSNDSTRATALTTQDGIYVKSGAPGHRYLGTIRTTNTAGQCQDSTARRFVWNCYNRAPRHMVAIDTTNSWTYTTMAWRPSHNDTTDGVGRVSFVVGLAEVMVRAQSAILAGHDSGSLYAVDGIALDATNTNHAQVHLGRSPNAISGLHMAYYHGWLAAGYHFLQHLEYSSQNVGTTTFYGDYGATNVQSGMMAEVEG